MLISFPYYKAMNYIVADMKVNLVITQWPSIVSNLVEKTRIIITTTEKEDNISHQKAKVFHKLETPRRDDSEQGQSRAQHGDRSQQNHNGGNLLTCQTCKKRGHDTLRYWSRFDNSFQPEDIL